MKNQAVVGVKAIKKNRKLNVDHDQHGVACTRILTPMYQPPNAAKLKVRLFKDAEGFYLLVYFGEKHLSSCSDDVDPPKITAAWVTAWAAELNALSSYTFHAIKAIQASEVSLSFQAAIAKLVVVARSKTHLSQYKKMTRMPLKMPRKSGRTN